MGGISITKILILVVLVVLLFGTKKLRGLGSDRRFHQRLQKSHE